MKIHIGILRIERIRKRRKYANKKKLIVCLTLSLIVSFAAVVYAELVEKGPVEKRSAPVTVVNTNSHPIPVTEVNKYPVQQQVAGKFNASAWFTSSTILYTVPLDKRLVIEYFSCRSNSGSYSTSYSCFISRINTGRVSVISVK